MNFRLLSARHSGLFVFFRKLRAIRWRSVRPLSIVSALPDYVRTLAFIMRKARPAPSMADAPPIDESGFDIVTVVFRAELDLLALQARSFDRFLDPAFAGRIIVIVNDLRCDHVIARIRAHVMAQYGRWRDRVEIVPFHALAHRLDPANGWIIQQVLKLACARLVTRPHYVVFDAKNHLVAPTYASRFVDAEGFALQTLEAGVSDLPEHDATCARYFGLDPADPERLRFASLTPFVLHTRSVRDLIRDVETREGTSLSDFFCDRRLISEFLLYAAFLESRADGIPAIYRDVPCKTVTIWSNGHRTVGGSILDVHMWDAFCFGIHRRVLASVGAADMLSLTGFWRSLRLIGPGEVLVGLSNGTRTAPSLDAMAALSPQSA